MNEEAAHVIKVQLVGRAAVVLVFVGPDPHPEPGALVARGLLFMTAACTALEGDDEVHRSTA